MGQLDLALIIFELVLSAVFLALSLVKGSRYFRGVGIGLVIAWVTSAVAVVYKRTAGAVPPKVTQQAANPPPSLELGRT